MNILVCDVCGRQLTKETCWDNNEELMKEFPDGMFSLEFRNMIVDREGKPLHYGWYSTCLCVDCTRELNRVIFEKAKQINESVPKTPLDVKVVFPPEPEVVMGPGVLGEPEPITYRVS